MSLEQVKELRGELSVLSKKHLEALQSAIYIGMNQREADEYDQSGARIHELYGLLAKIDA